jgi:hypothetical protein
MACLDLPLHFEQQLGFLFRRELQPRQLALDLGDNFGPAPLLKGPYASL